MSVLVRVGNRKAILRMGRWIAADSALEHRLNQATRRWIRETGGPPLQDPHQEYSVAREIMRQMEGRVLLHLKSSSRRSDRYFHSQRQLELEFSQAIPLTRRSARA